MRMFGAIDVFFIVVSHNVSFIGKTWWILMLVLRLLILLLAGFTLFSDEQERFICNTIQPGCSNVCFDVFAPVSVFRLWLVHLILLCLPHFMFVTYVTHKALSHPYFGGFHWFRGGSSSTFENLSLNKAPLHDQSRELAVPRFYCTYLLVIILQILLEAAFSAGQYFLFGLTIPKSFFCYEAPCTSGVECYISRPTEKTLMLNFMLAVASLSILLSLADLVSSMKAMVRWRRKREMLMEEMSKGEQSSMLTTTTVTEDSDVVLTRRTGSRMSGLRDEKPAAAAAAGGGLCESADEKSPESSNSKVEMCRPPTPMTTPVPSHYVLHSHLRPPLSPRPDRGPLSNLRVTTQIGVKKLSQSSSAGTNSEQHSDSSDCQDKRAWV
ncbi:gap junction delta-4 protein-like [Parambassis ranga]|uniref:Gap junction protein n=1 Tax=Parambassis ranga TaxID=210632 RepID=A0A6P7K1I7_9TELE|nr:gap junction delta-4 protein-like [Parambassis ranga]